VSGFLGSPLVLGLALAERGFNLYRAVGIQELRNERTGDTQRKGQGEDSGAIQKSGMRRMFLQNVVTFFLTFHRFIEKPLDQKTVS
jgi:hypothetical protein